MHNFDVVYYFDILYRVVVCEFGFTHYLLSSDVDMSHKILFRLSGQILQNKFAQKNQNGDKLFFL